MVVPRLVYFSLLTCFYIFSFDSNESEPSSLNEVSELLDNEGNNLHSVGLEEQAGWATTDMRSKGARTFLLKVLTKFFGYFNLEPPLKRLADLIPDPERKGIQTRRFFIETRGVKNPARYQVINHACKVFWVNNKIDPRHNRNDTTVRYANEKQPNTLMMEYRTIMGEFRREGIQYVMGDFAGTGGFLSIIMNKYPTMITFRPDIGRRPNKGECDPDFDRKIREQASPPLQPFSNPYDLLMLIRIQMGKHFILRGMKEVSFLMRLPVLVLFIVIICE